MPSYVDGVQETSISTGTGPFTVTGAVTGFKTFAAGYGAVSTPRVPVTIEAVDANGNASGDWMTFLGTFNGTTSLAVDEVLESSNANAAVNFTAGTKHIYTSIPAKVMQLLPDFGEAIAITRYAYIP